MTTERADNETATKMANEAFRNKSSSIDQRQQTTLTLTVSAV